MVVPAQVPLQTQPGTKWIYGIGLDILGRIIEVVSGVSLGEFFEKSITGPLGMTDTKFYLTDKTRLATLYDKNL